MIAASMAGGLPFFATGGGEKSHAPSPRHRQQARDSGKSWRSPDFQAGVLLLLVFSLWRWFLPYAGSRLGQMEASALTISTHEAFAVAVTHLFLLVASTGAWVVGPFAGILMAAGIALAIVSQGGLLFRPQAALPDINRINPMAGIQRMFSIQSLWNLLRGLLKIGIVAAVAGVEIWQQWSQFTRYLVMPLADMLTHAGQALTTIGLAAAAAFVVVGAMDLVVQRQQFEQGLKMSTQELRDEMKDTEGDPRLRGKRRELMRRLAKGGLSAVPQATVVVVNPVHFAVALAWDEATMAAPLVVAKGMDETAWEIRQVAERAKVPVVENPPVARALYEVPVGQPVPPAHYQVVADIIAFIIRHRRPGGAR